MTTMTRNTKNAVKKYGAEVCREAYHIHSVDGEGSGTVAACLSMTISQADAAINAGRELARIEAEALLGAHASQFSLTDTHALQKGDIVRTHGMIVRIGAKRISDQGAHADNGYGCAHYHLSEILAARPDMPQPGTRLWNVQGNRLAKWEKFNG